MPNVAPQVMVNKITFKCDDGLLNLLVLEANRKDECVSEVIRNVLEDYFRAKLG